MQKCSEYFEAILVMLRYEISVVVITAITWSNLSKKKKR